MKKIFAIIICLFILGLPLCACGSKKPQSPTMSVDGEYVSWSEVPSCECYSLRIMFDDYNGYEIQTKDTSYKTRFINKGTYRLKVRALVNGIYSAYSNEVSIVLEEDVNTTTSDDGKVTYRGSGTIDDPILIETANELLSIKNGTTTVKVNGVSKTVPLYYKQNCDIDFKNQEVSPIANSSEKFSGFYDGNGKTISNFTQSQVPKSGSIYMGIFGSLENASIINLNIKNYKVRVSAVSKGFSYGAIAGYSKESEIVNCHVDGEIYINSPVSAIYYGYVGMLVGESFGTTFDRCSSSGDIKVTFAKCFVGGIVGTTNIQTKDILKNCLSYTNITTHSTGRNNGVVETCSYAGGLIGYGCYLNDMINCVASSELKATAVDGADPNTIGTGIIGGGNCSTDSSRESYMKISNSYFNYEKMGLTLSDDYPTLPELINRYAIGGKTKKQNKASVVFAFDNSSANNKDTFQTLDFENVWEIKDGKLYLQSFNATHSLKIVDVLAKVSDQLVGKNELESFSYKDLFIILVNGKEIQVLDDYIQLSFAENGSYAKCNYLGKSAQVKIVIDNKDK